MTLLILAGTLLGAAMILAILFVDRIGGATWLMVLGGALMIYTGMGCLSRDVPRFKLALVLTLLAGAMAAVAMIVTFRAARELEQQIIRASAPRFPGGVIEVPIESEKGGRLATLRIAWPLCAAATAVNLLLGAYLPVRIGIVALARQRHPHA